MCMVKESKTANRIFAGKAVGKCPLQRPRSWKDDNEINLRKTMQSCL